MEEGLLVKEDRKVRWGVMVKEIKRLGYVGGPMVAVTLSQFVMQLIPLMMVGHLSKLSLSSTAIAISLAEVTGLTLLSGMAGALETLNGQAYGAQQYRKLGTQTNTGIFSLILVCIPLSFLWMYMGDILILLGQDPLISQKAGKFMVWLVPGLFGNAVLQPLTRYYQMQSLILPILISSFITICFHGILCWTLVFKTEMDNLGAAVSMNISIWLNAIILSVYMRYSETCAETRAPVSLKIFEGMREFFRFAIPSAVMVCLEWWSFELIVLLSGFLPNPQLETSVLSVCLNIVTTLYSIPFGLSGAGSTRISNKLGAGDPEGARVSVRALMVLAAADAIIVAMSLLASRNYFGYIFSYDKEVVDYVTNMAPLVCLSIVIDTIQGTLTGVARGCGWQHIGAYINLVAYYIFGVPFAAALSFWFKLGGKGLWIGILSGTTLQAVILAIITRCTNWEKQAEKARERFFVEKPTLRDGLI